MLSHHFSKVNSGWGEEDLWAFGEKMPTSEGGEGSLGVVALAHRNFQLANDERATVGKEGEFVRQHSIVKMQNQPHALGLFSAYGGSSVGI